MKHTGEFRPSKFCPTHNWHFQRPLFTKPLSQITVFPMLITILVFMALVLTWGLLTYGPSLTPSYQAPSSSTVSQEWLERQWTEYEKEVR